MSRKPSQPTAPGTWSHPLQVGALSKESPTALRLEPDAGRRKAIAAFLNVESVESLVLDVTLEPLSAGWRMSGTLDAHVVQACVITLEPVESRIEAQIDRRFMRGLPAVPEGDDVELAAADLDGPEPLGAVIDPGQVALETLALSIDPWPRARDAALETRQFAAPGTAPMTDEEARPFAGLRVLKGGRDDSDSGGAP